jgi:hypothetical protein
MTKRKKRHGGGTPLEDGVGRCRLWPNGPTVRPHTKAVFAVWRTAYGLPWGRIIDALIAHVEHDPTFRIPLKGAKKR